MADRDSYVGLDIDGQFRIVSKIGTGGMGTVYKAEQKTMARYVAIKILHPHYNERKDILSRFRREARAMSQLAHPNTARVMMNGELNDGALYYVMEFLEGQNLADLVREEGPMPIERAVPIIVQVCGALQEAHDAGIIHRDLKPENIVLTQQAGLTDFPKVLDFGLAKLSDRQLGPDSMILTQKGMVFGTPEFMSPEQARGDTLDPRSDVYSLAVILYEMLTGHLPFEHTKMPMEYLKHHMQTPPIRVSERVPGMKISKDIDAVMEKALSKRKEDRFESARAFGKALEKAARLGEPSQQVQLSTQRTSSQNAHAPTDLLNPTPSASQSIRVTEGQASALPGYAWVFFAVGTLIALFGVAAWVAYTF